MEKQGRIVTEEEAIRIARERLLQIDVPAGLARTVSVPILDVAEILGAVLDAWKKADEPKKLFPEDQPVTPEDIQLEVEEAPAEEAEKDVG